DRLLERPGAFRVVLQDDVAGADLTQRDRRILLVGELPPQLLLAQRRGVVPAADGGDLLRHLGPQLLAERGLLVADLDHLRMVRTEPVVHGRAPGAEIENAEPELLDPGTVEEIRERLGVWSGQELVAALERDALALRLRDE